MSLNKLIAKKKSGSTWFIDCEIPSMVRVSFFLPQLLDDKLEELVQKGLWKNRSEAIRFAIVSLFFDIRALEDVL